MFYIFHTTFEIFKCILKRNTCIFGTYELKIITNGAINSRGVLVGYFSGYCLSVILKQIFEFVIVGVYVKLPQSDGIGP